MSRLTLEIQSEREMAILTAFLKLLNVKILDEEKRVDMRNNSPEDFYKNINVNLANFKFNRDEANER